MTSEYFGFSESDGLGFGVGIFASLEPDINHVKNGLAELPSQFFDSTNLRTVLQIYLEEVQEIEQLLYDYQRFSSIEGAFGVMLDRIGEDVGVRREGLDDEDYRKVIKVKIISNSSEGTADTVISLWKFLLDTDDVSLKEEFPAGIELFSPTKTPTLEMIETVSEVVPITVKVGFLAGVSGTPFCFAGNVGLGFSSTESPTSGGQFVSRINI